MRSARMWGRPRRGPGRPGSIGNRWPSRRRRRSSPSPPRQGSRLARVVACNGRTRRRAARNGSCTLRRRWGRTLCSRAPCGTAPAGLRVAPTPQEREPAYGHAGSLARDVLRVGQRRLLAAYGLHLLFGVALADSRSARHSLFNAGEVVFRERYTSGTGVVFEVLAALGPWDGDDVIPLREQPREDELPRGDALAVGDLAHPVRQLQVLPEVLLREAWEAGAARVAVGHVVDAPPASG